MVRQKIKIKDIAKMAGVSAGTVDRILHNRGNVSRASREAVERVLAEVNYKFNLHISAISCRKTFRITVTTPIAMGVSEQLGGIVSITVAAVVFTGILGAILAPLFIKLFRIKDPVAAGLAIGACSHAVGTSKALELGEAEGAMSSIAIGVCGLMTVLFSLFLH